MGCRFRAKPRTSTQNAKLNPEFGSTFPNDIFDLRPGASESGSYLKETTGGEFRVCRASIRLLFGI